MGTLTAVFSRRTNLPLKLTKALTFGAVWSHCGVLDYERGVVIEALMGEGVVETPFYLWCQKYPHWKAKSYECPDRKAATEFARAQVGKGYDYGAVVLTPWRSSWDNPEKWYCSELLEASLTAGGRRRWNAQKLGVSPTDSWFVL